MTKEIVVDPIWSLRFKVAEWRHEDAQDWANQPRGVWDGATLERELDELFPVEVGLEALRNLKKEEVTNK